MAHKWAQWLHHPCLLGAPQCPSRGENQKSPTSGHNGYITPAFSGLPNAWEGKKIRNGPQGGTVAASLLPSRRSLMPSMGRKSEMAHKWGQGLHHPCLLGNPQCPARGENQKWPTKWAQWLHHPCLLGDSQYRAQGEKKMAEMWAQWLHHPCLVGDRQCRARGKNQKDHITKHSAYITPAFSGLPNAQQGEKIRNGPQVGTGATLLLPSRGSPMLKHGGKIRKIS